MPVIKSAQLVIEEQYVNSNSSRNCFQNYPFSVVLNRQDISVFSLSIYLVRYFSRFTIYLSISVCVYACVCVGVLMKASCKRSFYHENL